ncbi:MAG: TIM barrel protein [Pseudolysinimonas sp.]
MSRIGADLKFQDGSCQLAASPLATLDEIVGLGLDGLLVRTLDEAFPELDADDLAAFHRTSQALGLFVRMGIGKINPYSTAELPRVRSLGAGSYLAGMERMIRICASYGWNEVWTAVGSFKMAYPAPYCFDRFRTDVAWPAQLDATSRFIDKLAPTLRAEGVRLNIETHEEITTRELLVFVERHGADIIGICLDPANLPVRGESVIAGSQRVAPFTHLTHLRDVVLVPRADGISRLLTPIGQGQIAWDRLLPLLLGRDDVDLCIEAIGRSRADMLLQPGDPRWRASDPDLSEPELAELQALADQTAERFADGSSPDLAATPAPEYRDFLSQSLQALRLLVEGNAPLTPAHDPAPSA